MQLTNLLKELKKIENEASIERDFTKLYSRLDNLASGEPVPFPEEPIYLESNNVIIEPPPEYRAQFLHLIERLSEYSSGFAKLKEFADYDAAKFSSEIHIQLGHQKALFAIKPLLEKIFFIYEYWKSTGVNLARYNFLGEHTYGCAPGALDNLSEIYLQISGETWESFIYLAKYNIALDFAEKFLLKHKIYNVHYNKVLINANAPLLSLETTIDVHAEENSGVHAQLAPYLPKFEQEFSDYLKSPKAAQVLIEKIANQFSFYLSTAESKEFLQYFKKIPTLNAAMACAKFLDKIIDYDENDLPAGLKKDSQGLIEIEVLKSLEAGFYVKGGIISIQNKPTIFIVPTGIYIEQVQDYRKLLPEKEQEDIFLLANLIILQELPFLAEDEIEFDASLDESLHNIKSTILNYKNPLGLDLFRCAILYKNLSNRQYVFKLYEYSKEAKKKHTLDFLTERVDAQDADSINKILLFKDEIFWLPLKFLADPYGIIVKELIYSLHNNLYKSSEAILDSIGQLLPRGLKIITTMNKDYQAKLLEHANVFDDQNVRKALFTFLNPDNLIDKKLISFQHCLYNIIQLNKSELIEKIFHNAIQDEVFSDLSKKILPLLKLALEKKHYKCFEKILSFVPAWIEYIPYLPLEGLYLALFAMSDQELKKSLYRIVEKDACLIYKGLANFLKENNHDEFEKNLSFLNSRYSDNLAIQIIIDWRTFGCNKKKTLLELSFKENLLKSAQLLFEYGASCPKYITVTEISKDNRELVKLYLKHGASINTDLLNNNDKLVLSIRELCEEIIGEIISSQQDAREKMTKLSAINVQVLAKLDQAKDDIFNDILNKKENNHAAAHLLKELLSLVNNVSGFETKLKLAKFYLDSQCNDKNVFCPADFWKLMTGIRDYSNLTEYIFAKAISECDIKTLTYLFECDIFRFNGRIQYDPPEQKAIINRLSTLVEFSKTHPEITGLFNTPNIEKLLLNAYQASTHEQKAQILSIASEKDIFPERSFGYIPAAYTTKMVIESWDVIKYVSNEILYIPFRLPTYIDNNYIKSLAHHAAMKFAEFSLTGKMNLYKPDISTLAILIPEITNVFKVYAQDPKSLCLGEFTKQGLIMMMNINYHFHSPISEIATRSMIATTICMDLFNDKNYHEPKITSPLEQKTIYGADFITLAALGFNLKIWF